MSHSNNIDAVNLADFDDTSADIKMADGPALALPSLGLTGSSTLTGSSDDAKNKILYIHKYVNNLTIGERQDIYKIIVDCDIPDDKIVEKGAGIEIKFKHLTENAIAMIYQYIEKKIHSKNTEIESFPEYDIDVHV